MTEQCATLEKEVARLQSELVTEREAHVELDDVVKNLREELGEAREQVVILDEHCRRQEKEERERLRDSELEQHRAVAEERRKWEARKARLVRQLEELEKFAPGGSTAPPTEAVVVQTTPHSGGESVGEIRALPRQVLMERQSPPH